MQGDVLEDLVYLYYLNGMTSQQFQKAFLRTKFICII